MSQAAATARYRGFLRVWMGDVVLAMAAGPRRFNDMLHGIEGISDRVLSERLRELERAGYVVRDVDGGPPVRVRYELSESGRALVEPLQALAEVLA